MGKVTLAFVLLAFACCTALTRAETFFINNTDDASTVCLHMDVAISIWVSYLNSSSQENSTKFFNLTREAMVEDSRSTCDSNTLSAKLYITTDGGDELMDYNSPSMVFSFTGKKDGKDAHWSMADVLLNIESGVLDGYSDTDQENYTFNTTDRLHQDANANLSFSQYYTCKQEQNLTYDRSDIHIYPTVIVRDLRVQAFEFKNNKTGAFDDARDCVLDNTTSKANKIVPIAVGAALAGLVVVVLIAYLIGRLRSRRQSSYEALS